MYNRHCRLPNILAAILLSLFLGSCASLSVRTPDREFDHYYVVNGHSMHLAIEGTGTPVVFSAGAGVKDPYADFLPVTSVVRRYAKAVVFDRAGFGKSAPTDQPRDIDTVTTEMRDLFAAAGLRPPFILVGHSIASLEVLRFAQRWPGLVEGIVLIEGTPPSIVPTVMTDAMLEKGKRDVALGLMRRASLDEGSWWRQNAALIEKAGSFGNIPLVYIHRAGIGQVDWLGTYSDAPAEVTVDGKDHFVHHSHPDVVISEIRKLLDAVGAQSLPPG